MNSTSSLLNRIGRRRAGVIAAAGAAALIVIVVTLSSLTYATPAAGTIKVHAQGTPSGTEAVAPKVCAFNVEGFGFVKDFRGSIKFDLQGGMALGPFPFGPTDQTGYYATEYFEFASGQYQAVLSGANGQEAAKSKTFTVDCPEANASPSAKPSASPSTKPSVAPSVKPSIKPSRPPKEITPDTAALGGSDIVTNTLLLFLVLMLGAVGQVFIRWAIREDPKE